MEENDQLHDPAALFLGKDTPFRRYPLDRRLGGPLGRFGRGS